MSGGRAAGVVRTRAPAKINLYLHVLGRRPDGYHELDSLIAFADVGDEIVVEPAEDLSLAVDGPFAADTPCDRSNLVLRAAEGLAALAAVVPRARIRLTKLLPVASGVGGGSSDAAAALRALCALWRISLREEGPATPAAFATLALSLGADVPMCLRPRPAFAGGVGEVLDAAPALPEAGILLVNPGVAVPTPAVFKARSGPFSLPARFSAAPRNVAELARILEQRSNDLEAPAIAICPAVADVLDVLRRAPGALIARMSGSGATCFALFENSSAAADAGAAVRSAQPRWWAQAGSVAGARDYE